MDERRIAQIVEQVITRLSNDGPAVASNRAPGVLRHGRASGDVSSHGLGVFPTIDAAVESARRAFLELQQCSLQDRARFIEALRQVTRAELQTIAKMAVAETGLGRADDKVEKNRLVADKTPGVEALKLI